LSAVPTQPSPLEGSLREVDVVPLALALCQLSGDTSVLDLIEPYVTGPWDYSTTVPDDIRELICSRVASELARLGNGGRPHLRQPSDELLAKMMRVAVGQPVPEQYVPMALEQIGLASSSPEATWKADQGAIAAKRFQVLIVGAGAAGICAAIKLGEAGVPYVVIEKNDAVGGTWFENRYPGCAVDTPNHFYQYSFAPNNDWSHYYSRRAEVQSYLQRCADRYGVTPNIRFGIEATNASYDEQTARWRVTGKNADGSPTSFEANVLITAVGQLNRASVPEVPGIGNFRGQVVHTSAWHEGIQYHGRNVVLIGSGASAIQVGPAIAPHVTSLNVIQRAPSWLARSPNVNRSVSSSISWALDNIPYYAPWYRFQLFWGFADGLFPALRIDRSWKQRGTISALNERYGAAMLRYLKRELSGREDLIPKATPAYPPYGKRVLADPGWFQMLKRPNVHLRTASIKHAGSDSITLQDGLEIPADLIVFATGFQARRMLWPMEIVGRGGITIRERWGDDDPRAYLGITAPGFPNLFLLYGPNTNLGHGGSAIFLAECQVRYTVKCIRAILDSDARSLECRQEVHDTYNAALDSELRELVWSHPEVDTWYKNSTGRVVTNQPWTLLDYWRMTYSPRTEDFLLA
jgi:4-hydroxyacetophenone monooxygenase